MAGFCVELQWFNDVFKRNPNDTNISWGTFPYKMAVRSNIANVFGSLTNVPTNGGTNRPARPHDIDPR